MTNLGKQLAETAQEARRRQSAAHREAEKIRLAAREAEIEEVAQQFKTERLKHIVGVMSDLAARGQFKYKIWEYAQGRDQSTKAEGTVRGMCYVRDWLQEQGISAELRHYEENVLDYGYVNEWTLTASWGKEDV